jgi:hypothetical protein
VRVTVGDIASVAGAVAGVAAVVFAYLEYRRDRDEQPAPGVTAPAPQPMLEPAPNAWGRAAPAVDPRVALHVFLAIVAYVCGTLISLPLLLVPSRTVRYHALQSIGIDVLTILWTILGLVVGVIYVLIRFPGSTEPLPANDPLVTVVVFGIFVIELLPRFYCLIQVIRRAPARVPGVWRLAAAIAQRTERP